MLQTILAQYKRLGGSVVGGGMLAGNINQIAKMNEMRLVIETLRARFPNNVALQGYKVYSQNDEDGIIAAIFSAIGGGRTFLEIGVEDGTECNTHYLAIQGWRGLWVEADQSSVDAIVAGLGGKEFPGKFKLVHDFAKTDNIVDLYRQACDFCAVDQLDLFSLDIDGNDLFVLESLLAAGNRPTVICLEYNGKFPPPLKISVALDESRGWEKDDYFGASLQSFHDCAAAADYALVGCNVSGTNAFFVRHDRLSGLEEYTPAEAWQPMRPYLTVLPGAHAPTLKYMRDAVGR